MELLWKQKTIQNVPPLSRQILSKYNKTQQNLFAVTEEKLENKNTSALHLKFLIK